MPADTLHRIVEENRRKRAAMLDKQAELMRIVQKGTNDDLRKFLERLESEGSSSDQPSSDPGELGAAGNDQGNDEGVEGPAPQP